MAVQVCAPLPPSCRDTRVSRLGRCDRGHLLGGEKGSVTLVVAQVASTKRVS